jgi:hypothetical protein
MGRVTIYTYIYTYLYKSLECVPMYQCTSTHIYRKYIYIYISMDDGALIDYRQFHEQADHIFVEHAPRYLRAEFHRVVNRYHRSQRPKYRQNPNYNQIAIDNGRPELLSDDRLQDAPDLARSVSSRNSADPSSRNRNGRDRRGRFYRAQRVGPDDKCVIRFCAQKTQNRTDYRSAHKENRAIPRALCPTGGAVASRQCKEKETGRRVSCSDSPSQDEETQTPVSGDKDA